MHDKTDCPLLFHEDDPEAARSQPASPDKPALHNLHNLLADFSTNALNNVSIGESENFKLVAVSKPRFD